MHISTDQPQIFHPLADQLHLHELTREKVQAWRNSAEYKELRKIGDKYATFRAFAVEGVPQ